MRIRNVTVAASALAIAGLGLVAYAQPKPVSSPAGVVVYKSPT